MANMCLYFSLRKVKRDQRKIQENFGLSLGDISKVCFFVEKNCQGLVTAIRPSDHVEHIRTNPRCTFHTGGVGPTNDRRGTPTLRYTEGTRQRQRLHSFDPETAALHRNRGPIWFHRLIAAKEATAERDGLEQLVPRR